MFKLTDKQIERYSRQIILPEVGGAGQKKLLKSKVLIIGCGGLGSSCAYYLTAAGVGTIGLVDSDKIELNNLQRQILHFTRDVGKPKVNSAKAKLSQLNPDTKLKTYHLRLTSKNILSIIKKYDVIIDGSDNFPTKYLINDACVLLGKPFIHAGILKLEGQATTIIPKKGPCYRCVFPTPPLPGAVPTCQQAGILGVVAGVLGLVQTTEALKYILKVGELLVGRLLVFNALDTSFRTIKIKRNKNCPVCGVKPTIKKLIDYEKFCRTKGK